VDEVIDEMEKGKGKQFDPQILEIFLKGKIYDSSKAV
jgi:HD-GYP domain-containing protein (c-di-GMP phosphodiesterase class II)